MSWLYIVFIGYSLNAIASIIDKFLLTKSIPKPATYTFNIGLLNGLFTLFLIPLGISLLSPFNIFISLLAGLFFALALFTMYLALKKDEVSRIMPYIGSLSPIFIFIFANLILGEKLKGNQLIAFFLIIIGSVLISWRLKKQKKIYIPKKGKNGLTKIFIIATLSAILFALSYTLTKYIYNSTSFLNGFIWTRFGLFFGALLIMLTNQEKRSPKTKKPKLTKKTGIIFLFGQFCGGLSFFLINYAFSLNSVTLVQSLQGIQYVVLFLIIIILSKKFPKIIQEKLTPTIIIQKTMAIVLIGFGLYFLTI